MEYFTLQFCMVRNTFSDYKTCFDVQAEPGIDRHPELVSGSNNTRLCNARIP